MPSVPVLFWLLAQAAIVEEPIADLRGIIVDAIRNCIGKDGEILVCSKDRGFAEGQRVPEIQKPKPPPGDPGVKIEITGGQSDPGTPR